MASGLVQQEPPRLHQAEQDGVSVSLIMLANLVEQTIHLPRTCLHPLIAHVKAYGDAFPQQVNEWIASFIPLVAKVIEDTEASVDAPAPGPRAGSAATSGT